MLSLTETSSVFLDRIFDVSLVLLLARGAWEGGYNLDSLVRIFDV